MSPRRGQFFGADLVLAVVLAITLFLAYLTLASLTDERARAELQALELRGAAGQAAAHLALAPGTPANWSQQAVVNATTVRSLGLALKPRHLAEDRVLRLFSMVNDASLYPEVRKLLGLDRAGYNYSLTLLRPNGTALYNTTFAAAPANATAAYADQAVLFRGDAMRLRIGVWIVEEN